MQLKEAGVSIYLNAHHTKSAILDRLPTHVVDKLRNDLTTVGKFEFVDEGNEWFSHVNSFPMPFIEAAKEATEAYAASRETRFARLVVADCCLGYF